jgi:hypothetical protein
LNQLIFDGDTFYDIYVMAEDYEVEDIWGKWKPIENEESNAVEIKDNWNIKQKALGHMRKNKVKIVEGVYQTYYEKYTLLVNRRDGKVYHFDNHIFELEVNNQEIYLRKIDNQIEKCVYKNGEFSSIKSNWLIECSQKLSKSKCKGIKICSHFYGRIEIKNHQIIAAMFFGMEAIEKAIGDNATHDINHRNLQNEDNRPENLEIVTKAQNSEHSIILKNFLNEILAEVKKELGITNYSIIKRRRTVRR